MKDFIETKILSAVRGLLSGRVNEILGSWEYLVPVIEFGNIGGSFTVAPVVSLSGCEQTEQVIFGSCCILAFSSLHRL